MTTLATPVPASSNSTLTTITRVAAAFISASVIALSIAGIALGAFEIMYGSVVYPGISVHGIELSGLTRGEAIDRLSREFAYTQTPSFTFRYQERAWTATPAELGVTFSAEATADRAFAYGRSGNLWVDLQDQFWGWYEGVDVAPTITYEPNRAADYLRHVAGEIDAPPIEAALTVNGTQVTVTPGQFGYTVNINETLQFIADPISRLGSADAQLVIDEYKPGVLDASAQAAIAQQILSQPMTLTVDPAHEGDPGPWTFTPEQLAAMLVIQRVDDAAGARYEVMLNAIQLQPFLETIAPTLEVHASDARFIFNDETRELEIIPGKEAVDGRTLNIAATIQNINAQAVTGVHSIGLVFDITKPAIGNDTKAADLGITGLVTDQDTYFVGSSAERINNITVGAAAFHGILIPPGGTFSFNEWLGDISLDSGFSEALIIYAGRTIKGVGGGICQVSTTVFRAAFYGGYPIVERHSHAYRVGYYEQGTGEGPLGNTFWSGPGLDATIFTPVADFKFQNDRDAWLLIESYVYNNRTLEFRFYSADDGRKVTVSQPEVKNTVAAPPDKYELNPELATGDIKQVDYKADGADTTVWRKVERNGEVLWEDAIKTHYLPWQAIYQYGPDTQLTVQLDENGEVVEAPPPSGN